MPNPSSELELLTVIQLLSVITIIGVGNLTWVTSHSPKRCSHSQEQQDPIVQGLLGK